MKFGPRRIFLLVLMVSFLLVGTLALTVIVGFAFGFTRTNDMRDLLQDRESYVPTQIFDRNGRLISELVGEQKRTIVYFHELPIETISALISREDPRFFYHSGFSLKSTLRAVFFLGKRGGGSTISQQTAGVKFCNRREISIKRKIKELWYSFNLERDLSKAEIIQLYLNEVYFGHGAFGIEAASQFFFKHPAKELNLAESAIIVTPVSNPTDFSPLRYPETAKVRQRSVLNRMVGLHYVTQAEADAAFTEFWEQFSYDRSPDETYHDINESKAPYFTDYIRNRLLNILTGTANIYKDGYRVETTLDLDLQHEAEAAAQVGIDFAEDLLKETGKTDRHVTTQKYIPIVDLLCLANNISGIDRYTAREERKAQDQYLKKYSSLIAAAALLSGNEELQYLSEKTDQLKTKDKSKKEVQTSLIAIENNTGRILAMVGGREYDNQFESAVFNRATMGKITPGSAIKPLYYSAAISDRIITPATELDDSPVIFYQKGSDPYQPHNYMDKWYGPVLVRHALKSSLNIPAIEVLSMVGYDSAITRMTDLLGMQPLKNDEKAFPRKLPLALGIIQVSPLSMARAYAAFENRGVATEPHGILSIKDRNGNPIAQYGNIGYDLEETMNQNRSSYRILSPEEAFMMTDLLQSTVDEVGGLLYWRSKAYNDFDGMPMAGKTGTSQNWEDAWTVGFSPYMTCAVWYGFDEGNQSFGPGGTGASLAGRAWADFMYNAHKNLPVKAFYRPDSGIVEKQICSRTGFLARSSCPKTRTEIFLEGTEPTSFCEVCAGEADRIYEEREKIKFLQNLEVTSSAIGITDELKLPSTEELLQTAINNNPGTFSQLEKENPKPADTDDNWIDLGESHNSYWN